MTTSELRYPIGQFSGESVNEENRPRILLELSELPGRLRDAMEGLTNEQLDTRYRPEGWTVRQVVHHMADSHMHSYIRTRFALTENEPTIMPYDENRWSEFVDARTGPVEPSLLLLEGLHTRWVRLLKSLTPADWEKTFVHPERGLVTVSLNTAIYAWHSRHHTAHITALRKRMGWG